MTRPSLAGIERGDHAWEVKCPTCGAAPGRPCYGNGEMPRHMTHGARAAVRLKALTTAVRVVLRLHTEREHRPLDGIYLGGTVCNHCRHPWPCATRRALADRLDLTDPEGEPS